MSISDVELDRKKLLEKIRAMSPCHDAYNQKAGITSEVRFHIYTLHGFQWCQVENGWKSIFVISSCAKQLYKRLCPSVHRSIRRLVRRSVGPSIHRSVGLTIGLSVHLIVRLLVCPSVGMSAGPSVSPSSRP